MISLTNHIIHSYKHFKYVSDCFPPFVCKINHNGDTFINDYKLNRLNIYVTNNIKGLNQLDNYKHYTCYYKDPITKTNKLTKNVAFKERKVAGGKILKLTIILLPP